MMPRPVSPVIKGLEKHEVNFGGPDAGRTGSGGGKVT